MKTLLKLTLAFILTSLIIITVLFGYADLDLDLLKEKYAQPPSAFIPIMDMEVHFRDEGNPQDSLPIVLIHGTGASLHTFDAWVEGLKNERRIIRMDLPGFGLTGPFPDRDYTMIHYVKFIEAFLTQLNIDSCVLGGNSLGGQIAWNYTVENSKTVKKLILIDAAGYPLESEKVPVAFAIAKMPVLNKILTFITPKFMAKSSVESVYADKSKVTEELVARYFELTLREGNRQGLVDRMTTDIKGNQIELIKTIEQPTLILWGADDLLATTKSAYRFQTDLSNDTLVIMPNVGHVPMEESPIESLAIVKAFIK
ncbi:alpha/beta fold hydrolase [Reichenbachiella sp.]|uniref:alpha/beta fold hydrolase n=1 Tax=Reichenbachiella sp. TaxID=2184521 RepID=UPI003BB18F2C